MNKNILLSAGLITVLSACGDGGSGAGPNPPATTAWRVAADSPYSAARALLDFRVESGKTELTASKLPAGWTLSTSLSAQHLTAQAATCPAPKLNNGTYLCVKLNDGQGHVEGLAVESPDGGATLNVYTDWAFSQLKNPVGDAAPPLTMVNFLKGTIREVIGNNGFPPDSKAWSLGSGTVKTALISRPQDIFSGTVNADGSFELSLPAQPAGVVGLHAALFRSNMPQEPLTCQPFQGTQAADMRIDYPLAAFIDGDDGLLRVEAGGAAVGVLPLVDASSPGELPYTAFPIYASKSGTVKGTVICENTHVRVTYEYDVTLQTGWQWVGLASFGSPQPGQKTQYYSKLLNIVTTDWTWYGYKLNR